MGDVVSVSECELYDRDYRRLRARWLFTIPTKYSVSGFVWMPGEVGTERASNGCGHSSMGVAHPAS